MSQPQPSDHASEIVAQAKHKRFIASAERKDGGPGFWIVSNRPFDEVATELIRSALRACKPAPTVLGSPQRKPSIP